MLIDTHVHLDAPEFGGNALELASQARHAGVLGLVLPSVWPANFGAVSELSHAIPGAVYALGIHPMYVHQCQDSALVELKTLVGQAIADPRFVAIGEIGLDYFVPGLDRERQLFFFQQQLRIAREFDLPVLMHVRRSVDHITRECRKFGVKQGIAHAFNGSEQQALILRSLGLCLGFGGAMTYTRALQLRRLAQDLPLDCLVLETDAPDIAPAWLASETPEQPNTPQQMRRIAELFAGLRGVSLEQIAAATTANALRSLPRLLHTVERLGN